MFYDENYLLKSSLLDSLGICHGFSTRHGGVSTLPHTASMNIADGHGDSEETVKKNTDILIKLVTDGHLGKADGTTAPQIHSAIVTVIDESFRGNGILRPSEISCDGFATDRAGVVPIVRTADCVPIIMGGRKVDGSPIIAVLHAGWRGTVNVIAAEGVNKLVLLGAVKESVRVAIGPHIGKCCFEVGEDLLETVIGIRGEDFARRHVKESGKGDGKYFADLTGMNVEILTLAGVKEENIDVCTECTSCLHNKYHSHRKGKGMRGAMGSAAAILK